VSDPRTGPGVRVGGPGVGSLTSRVLCRAGHRGAKDASRTASEVHATTLHKANALQEKAPGQIAAVIIVRQSLSW
jgi:hypothetical protein